MSDVLKINADQEYEFPLDRYYLAGDSGHVWIKKHQQKDIFRIGFDALGASQAGAIRSVRTRKPGKKIKQLKAIGTLESGKWIGPVKMPFTGEIIAVNEKVKENPELINEKPYTEGWIAEIRVDQATLNKEQNHEKIIKIGDKETLKLYIKHELKRFELV